MNGVLQGACADFASSSRLSRVRCGYVSGAVWQSRACGAVRALYAQWAYMDTKYVVCCIAHEVV